MKSGKFRAGSAAVLACAVVTAQARWIEDGVGAAWGTVPAETPAETAAAYVPWDDGARTRATVGTLALAATVPDSNTVVVAGAGVEALNGVYTLEYSDEYSAEYYDVGWAHKLGINKETVPWYAWITDTGTEGDAYATWNWPVDWTVLEYGVEPAPTVGFRTLSLTNELTRSEVLLWDSAYGWGNHADAGYLVAESDPASVHLDQGTPQAMTGFPEWMATQALGGRALANANGNNDCVMAAHTLAAMTNGCVSFWAKTTTSVSGAYTKYIWQTESASSATNVFRCWQNDAQGLTVQLTRYPGGSGTVTLASPGAVNDGAWRFFAASWDGSNARLYVDGAEVDSEACGAVGSGTCNVKFGYYGGTSRCFTGSTDELAFWKRTLSAAEVLDLYRYRIGVGAAATFPSTGVSTTNALLQLYRCDEADGSAITNAVTGTGYAFRYGVSFPADGQARSASGTAATAFLGTEADAGLPADYSKGLFRVGNAEATTKFLGALRVGALHAAPASATAAGLPGDVRVATDALYVCTATNTWVKAALATW